MSTSKRANQAEQASTSTPALTVADIRQLASPESFRRGQEYAEAGAVLRLTRRGNQLLASVQGSEYEPYRVAVTSSAAGIDAYECTCPYDWGGACKHVVAALLVSIEQPASVEERPDAATLLQGLDADQLRTLLVDAVQREPDLADWIEVQTQVIRAQAAAGSTGPTGTTSPQVAQGPQRPQQPSQKPAVDPAPFRRQVRAALRSLGGMRDSEAYWHVGGIAQEVVDVAKQAQPFIDAGDGQSALAILDTVTAEYVNGWTDLDDSDGEASDAYTQMAPLWTEALLTADLTKEERQEWADKLARWQKDLDDYGVDDVFDAPRLAALQGWDDPQVQQALRGEVPAGGTRPGLPAASLIAEDEEEDDEDKEDEEDEEDWDEEEWVDEDWDEDGTSSAAEVARVRLRILERQGRTEECLNLARVAGLHVEYTTLLVRQGRVADAVAYGLERLTSIEDVYALAVALLAHGATEEALRIAEHGLALEDQPRQVLHYLSETGQWVARMNRGMLASWLRDAAAAAGQQERALRAATVAFREQTTLANYVAARKLAGEQWPALREEFLAHVRSLKAYDLASPVDIFLDEGLVDDAIAFLDANAPMSAHQYAVLERVADAAIDKRPEWVIQTARQQAERIMDGGKSQYYREAARWLERMRDAAKAAGDTATEEWRAYLEELLVKHKRRYALTPLLRQVLGEPPERPRRR